MTNPTFNVIAISCVDETDFKMLKRPFQELVGWEQSFLEQLIIILVIVAALIILYEYRHIFSSLNYRRALKSIEKNVEQPSKQIMRRVCPRCGDNMEEGYLVGPNGIYWSKDVLPSMLPGSRLPFFTPVLGSEPLTFSGFPFSDRIPSLKAYRCRKCGIIFADLRSQDFGIA